MQMVLWCYPRHKQAGWWEVADAELGCRKAQTLVLLCLEELTCASPGLLWFCSLCFSWNERCCWKEGRKLSQQWSLFSLCIVKQSVALVCGSAEGFFFFCHSKWASLHGNRRGALVHRALQAGVGRFIWKFGTRQQCLGYCIYYYGICNTGLRMHPYKHVSRRTVYSGYSPSCQKPNWFKVREERRERVVVAWCQIQRGGIMCPQAASSAHKPSEQERGQTACIGTAVSSHFLTAGGPWMHRPHWWDVLVLTFSVEGFVSPKA